MIRNGFCLFLCPMILVPLPSVEAAQHLLNPFYVWGIISFMCPPHLPQVEKNKTYFPATFVGMFMKAPHKSLH